MKVAILYGSTTGKTAAVAGALERLLPGSACFNVSHTSPVDLDGYDTVLLGVSTWGTGALQHDWEGRLRLFPRSALEGRSLAFFGLGDRVAFRETFCTAVALLEAHFLSGRQPLVPTLLLDDDNEPERTAGLVAAWAESLKARAKPGR